MSAPTKPDQNAIGQSIAKHILLLQKEGLIQTNKTDYTASPAFSPTDIKSILDVLNDKEVTRGRGGAATDEAPLLDNYRKVSDYFNLNDKPTITYALSQAITGLPAVHTEDGKNNKEEIAKKALEELEKYSKGP
ncbi:uncharacterized protein I206_102316 [Kwoniella pini CBS 10737]|uniref:Uncharacterized protein n=1 Tax=Kwoniella pini CBS 10737 TaxID=1296096 RepID=A0A1B9HT61_9TREE|nr:uncharacterized protein I206_07686 [Kwoniella pini CBS 10737]OCF46451.1 hypothetical protein I206_07686 [Kwoniella pini CBS 10737]